MKNKTNQLGKRLSFYKTGFSVWKTNKMKTPLFFLILAMGFVLSSCNDEPSLEEYYVESHDKKDFVTLDIPSAIFLGTDSRLAEAEKQKLRAIEKANILAYSPRLLGGQENDSIFQAEKIKIEKILDNEEYKLLMQASHSGNKMKVMYVGETESIDEMIFYGAAKDFGFAVVRILGNDMDPQAVVDYIRNFNSESNEGNDFDSSQLESLMEVFSEDGMEGLQRVDSVEFSE
jgi:hypothetical protein